MGFCINRRAEGVAPYNLARNARPYEIHSTLLLPVVFAYCV